MVVCPCCVCVTWVSGHHHSGEFGEWGAARFVNPSAVTWFPVVRCHGCISAAATGLHCNQGREPGFQANAASAPYPPWASVWGLHPNSSTSTMLAGAPGSATGAGELRPQALSLSFPPSCLPYVLVCGPPWHASVEQSLCWVTEVHRCKFQGRYKGVFSTVMLWFFFF